jgi:hypothetical protein
MRQPAYACGIALLSLVAPACGASSQSGSGPGGSRQTAAQNAGAVPTGNPCERKLIGEADVAGIMTSPVVKMEPLEGDRQSCVFSTALQSHITVMVRPGLGNVTVSGWEKGQMNLPVTAVTGVGDRAVWQDTLNEVIATKNDVLCDISVMGPPGTAAAGAQKRLGDLCNTIFSRQ